MNNLVKKYKCYVCKEYKEASHFWLNKSRSSGLSSKCKKCSAKRQLEKKVWRRPGRVYASYKRGAKKRGYSFDISKDYFTKLANLNCFYCGDIIDGIRLDRIDNTKGYSIDNCVPCCWICNKMKSTLTHEEFINQCIKISNNI